MEVVDKTAKRKQYMKEYQKKYYEEHKEEKINYVLEHRQKKRQENTEEYEEKLVQQRRKYYEKNKVRLQGLALARHYRKLGDLDEEHAVLVRYGIVKEEPSKTPISDEA